MEHQDIVKYLKTYEQLYHKMIYLEGQIVGIKAIRYEYKTGTKQKSIHDYMDEKDALEKEMIHIEKLIDAVTNPNARYALMYRFIQFKKLEDVAIIMGYSTRQISRYYKKGIEEIKDVMLCHGMSYK